MAWLQTLGRRLRTLSQLGAVEASMDREMRAHIEFETAARVKAGLDPAAARATALRDFGPAEAFKEAGRDARGTRAVEDCLRDVTYAARMFANHRTFSISAILTFALGIGAATAIFSVVYGVLLRPLPYADPDQLVTLWEHNVTRGLDRNVVSVASFERWRESRAFEAVAAMVPAPVTLPSPDGAERIVGADVSPGFFRMLGATPLLGREFTDADAGAGNVLMISEEFWRSRFDADPSVIGRRIPVDGRPHGGAVYEIVGVMPADFQPPAYGWMARRQPMWFPFTPTDDNRAFGRYLLVIARLRGGVPLDAARDELVAVAARLERVMPQNSGWSAAIAPLRDVITGDVRVGLLYILAAVGLLLLLALTNVATLLVERTKRRLPELGLRRALGASDARLRRQIVAECLLLGTAGCVAGLLLAYPLVAALVALIPAEIPRVSSIRLDTVMLGFATGAALLASLIIGLMAARGGRRAPSSLLREASSRGSRRTGGRALVIAEVAIGLVIAVLAGLVIRSFNGLRDVDLGFDPNGVVIGRVALGAKYATPESRHAFYQELLVRTRALPRVQEAGRLSGRPFGGIGPRTTVRDALTPAAATDILADGRWADADAMRALGISVVSGTLFDGTDRIGGTVRVVVNESLAKMLWPKEQAVGRTMAIHLQGGLEARVIGVVGDMHQSDARTAPRPGFFLAADRFGGEAYDLIVRAEGDPSDVVPGLRAVLAELDASLPLHRVEEMDHAVDTALALDRFTAFLLSGFAALALLLASVGIYGVFAGDVAARRKDIGIRIALGARPGRLVGEIVGRATTSALAGIAIGAGAALVLARSMQSILFGVAATDVWSFAMAAAAVLMVTLAATLIPAVHSTRVSPLLILRGD